MRKKQQACLHATQLSNIVVVVPKCVPIGLHIILCLSA